MTPKLDPITLELIHSKVTSVIEEMRIVLFHSGYSTVLRESEDGSAGLLDARLRTVSVSKKLPLHFGSFAAVADHLSEYYRMEDFADGDVVVFNHPLRRQCDSSQRHRGADAGVRPRATGRVYRDAGP